SGASGHADPNSNGGTMLSAGQDLNFTAQGQWSAVAAKGIALYAQGSAPAGGRPVTKTGIALHAASGKASVQAQQDKADFAAEKAITLASTHGSIHTNAKKHILLTAAGAYLKMQGGDIEIGAPGKAQFKGAQREMAGPQSSSSQAALVESKAGDCELRSASAGAAGDMTVSV
ncbi:MAG: DUF2345 domain-containing protein, partial [Rhodanobacter sp.]